MPILGEIIYRFFSSYVALFVICFAFSFLGFYNTYSLTENKRMNYIMPGLALSLLNSCAVLALFAMFPEHSALVVLIGIPLAFVLENKIIVSENDSFFVFLFLVIAVNFVALYDIMTAILNVFNTPDNVVSDIGKYRIFLLNAALLAVISLFGYIRFGRIFPVQDLKLMLHSKNHGALIYSTSAIILAVLCVTAVFLSPVSGGSFEHFTAGETLLNLNCALKALAILALAYFILQVQGWQEGRKLRSEQLRNELDKEMLLRENINSDKLMNYCINLSTGIIEDGTQYFSEVLLRGADRTDGDNNNYIDYGGMIDNLKQLVVHEDYWDLISKTMSKEVLVKRAKDEYQTFCSRVMISPEKAVEFCRFSEKNEKKLSSYEKKWIWAEIFCSLVKDKKNDELLAYVSINDIEKKVSEEKDASGRFASDELTGLPGAEAAEDLVREKMLEKNMTGALFAVRFVNYDAVKEGTDPEESGDILKKAAQRLAGVFRGKDIIGRTGECEFVVFTAGLTNREIITERAVRVNEYVRTNIVMKDGTTAELSAKTGIALFPDDGKNYDDLFDNAKKALEAAESSEGKLCCFYGSISGE